MTTTPSATPGSSTTTDRAPKLYDVVVAVFCSLLLISNIAATKLIGFGPSVTVGNFPVLPIITDGGALLFPLTYILGDVLAEVYGLSRARRAILIGFAMALLASVTFMLVDLAPPAPGWDNQEAWHSVLGFVPRIVAASLAGYLAGQFLNAWVVVRLKNRTKPGSLSFRLVSSTVVGELADTAIFCTIAFAGVVTVGTLLNYIVVGYIYKVLIEVVMLPVTVRVIAWVKRREGISGTP